MDCADNFLPEFMQIPHARTTLLPHGKPTATLAVLNGRQSSRAVHHQSRLARRRPTNRFQSAPGRSSIRAGRDVAAGELALHGMGAARGEQAGHGVAHCATPAKPDACAKASVEHTLSRPSTADQGTKREAHSGRWSANCSSRITLPSPRRACRRSTSVPIVSIAPDLAAPVFAPLKS